MKEKELCLIKHLREDSRKSLTQISKETEIPISTLFNLLRKIEKESIIKHSTLIDFSKIGYNIKVHFAFKSNNKVLLKNYLIKNKHINNLYSVTNDCDFYAECIFQNLNDLTNFKDDLINNRGIIVYENFIIDEIKKEEFDL